jgi:hypothetical protein
MNSAPVLFTLTWHLLLRHARTFVVYQAEGTKCNPILSLCYLHLYTEKYMYDNVVVHIISYDLHASFVVNNHTFMYE